MKATRILSRRGSQRRTINHKPSKARRARKPEDIEIEGHLLTREQRDELTQARDLTSFLWPRRPSVKAEQWLAKLYDRTMHAALATGHMKQYPFYKAGAVRKAGCEALKTLGMELYWVSYSLLLVAGQIEGEEGTHLQDWQEFEQRLERLEKDVAPPRDAS